MIYLLLKIFTYLVVALGLGGACGWLLRNLTALRHEAAMNRQLLDAQRRVTELESRVRGREEKGRVLAAKIRDHEALGSELEKTLKLREEALQEKDRRISALKGLLSEIQSSPKPAGPQPVAQGEAESETRATKEEFTAPLLSRIEALEQDLQRAERALRHERRRIEELERERELQNRTLQALNQQLEISRESRRAAGG